jgi:hypothetical protein
MPRGGSFQLGVVLVLATLAGVGVSYLFRGAEMFSPGQLQEKPARSASAVHGVHSHAEIADNCAACHAGPWSEKSQAALCMDCHNDVSREVSSRSGFHGHLADVQSCRHCHSEHNGAAAKLVDLAQFDHSGTAFPLTGKHQTAACESCHKNQVFQEMAHSCVDCHHEPASHRGKFGVACATCHSTVAWTGATFNLASFDHRLTGFPLTGRHQSLACASCHKNQVFQAMAHACVDCHQEPAKHSGRFGVNCASCHSTTAWSGATFAHKFPLNHGGAMRKTETGCATCHQQTDDPKAYTCYGCHEHEPTRIARKHRRLDAVKLARCADCHFTGRGDRGENRDRKRSADDLLRTIDDAVAAAPSDADEWPMFEQ